VALRAPAALRISGSCTLVPVLGIAAWRGFVRIRWFAIPWAAGGAMVSTWHVLIERFPDLEGSTSCDPVNPCSLIWVEQLGYLTIPTMALSGFLAIIALLASSPAAPPTTSTTTSHGTGALPS
jgi:disulfide bond formation protein DsbB